MSDSVDEECQMKMKMNMCKRRKEVLRNFEREYEIAKGLDKVSVSSNKIPDGRPCNKPDRCPRTGKKFIEMSESEFVKSIEERFSVYQSSGSSSSLLQENSNTDIYNFEHQKRGLALILNNESFFIDGKKQKDMKRSGSKVDETLLKEAFRFLGFDVELFRNLAALQMSTLCKKAAEMYPHDDADCLVCSVLSHGNEKERDRLTIKGSDCEILLTSTITNCFNVCLSLKDKPRLFFVQACRGKRNDPGGGTIRVHNDRAAIKDDHQDDKEELDNRDPVDEFSMGIDCASLYKDCMIMYAVCPGYKSKTHYKEGSFFIKALCKCLKRETVIEKSFLRVLTSVCYEVAVWYESKKEKYKNMPVVETNLIKDIIMKKKQTK